MKKKRTHRKTSGAREFGLKIKKMRRAVGLSLSKVAKGIGVSASFVSNVEFGRAGYLTDKRIRSFCALVNADPDELLKFVCEKKGYGLLSLEEASTVKVELVYLLSQYWHAVGDEAAASILEIVKRELKHRKEANDGVQNAVCELQDGASSAVD